MWRPQPGPQSQLLSCDVPEVFFGGSRFGGKTDGVLGKYLYKALKYGRAFNAVFFRKEMPSLDDVIERSHEIYGPMGAVWQDQKKTWRFPNGARIRFRSLENLKDAGKYQGQNFSDICLEEAGEYSTPDAVFRLFGALRSAKGAETQFILTGNPGGPGHAWLKERYVKPAPAGNDPISTIKKYTDPITGEVKEKTLKRIYIPSKPHDNKIGMANDPDYVFRIQQSGSAALVKAWLTGDWNAIEGAFFDCFTENLIVEPFHVPDRWPRYRSMDWGSASPFAVHWWAIATEAHHGIPKDALVCYREWYGAKATEAGTYKGLKLTAEEVAKGILERQSTDFEFKRSVADPSMFKTDGGPSIAKRMWDAGAHFLPADNKRVSKKDAKGPMGGWDQMRARMKDNMIFFFDTCEAAIRTLPSLPHDTEKPEDLDTTSEDHAADSIRYMCLAKPYLKREKKPKQEINYFYDHGITVKEDEGWLR